MFSQSEQSNKKPRTLIVSLRKINNYVFNSCLHEFEDIVFEVENAHLLSLPAINFLDRVKKKFSKVQLKEYTLNLGNSNHLGISL